MNALRTHALIAATMALSAWAGGCGDGKTSPPAALKGDANMSITLQSPTIQQGQPIPSKHAYETQNVSPALEWSGQPAGVKSFALISDDPDAPHGTWTHWVMYNIPADRHSLAEGISDGRAGRTAPDLREGTTDFKTIGWGGPAPPRGTHRYYFHLYALDTVLDLPAGATAAELRQAMAGHVLAEGELMATFTAR